MTLRRLMLQQSSHIRESWTLRLPHHPWLRGLCCGAHLLLVPLVMPLAWLYMRLTDRA